VLSWRYGLCVGAVSTDAKEQTIGHCVVDLGLGGGGGVVRGAGVYGLLYAWGGVGVLGGCSVVGRVAA